MGYNVTQALAEVRQSCLEFPDGQKLLFGYKPNAYTPNHDDEVAAALDTMRSGNILRAMVLPLLDSWDAEQEVPRMKKADDSDEMVPVVRHGKPVVDMVPVPLTPEGIGVIPHEILRRIHAKIIEEMTPGEANGTSSGGSFT